MTEFTTGPDYSHIRILLLGPTSVGKTALACRFLNYNPPQEHKPTIEDYYKTKSTFFNRHYECEVLDTSGSSDYANFREKWINYADGIVLVFALNDKDSFQEALRNYAFVMEKKNATLGQPLFLLVGNKQDLDTERAVPYSEAKEAADLWMCEYVETSAATDFNCKEAFEKIGHLVAQRKLNIEASRQNGGGCEVI